MIQHTAPHAGISAARLAHSVTDTFGTRRDALS